jgi:hypothetical protein
LKRPVVAKWHAVKAGDRAHGDDANSDHANSDHANSDHAHREAGSAIVEFLGVTLVLLVPIIYLILAVAEVQRASFAAEAVAYDIARTSVVAGVSAVEAGQTPVEASRVASEHVLTAVPVVLAGFGIQDDGRLDYVITCDGECFTAGSAIEADVEIDVPLPGMSWTPLSVSVRATGRAAVDRFGP